MNLNINRHRYIILSFIAIAFHWCEILIAPEYQISGMATPESVHGLAVTLGGVLTLIWLASIAATKKGWLWITGLFSWILMGLTNTSADIWIKLSHTDCPKHFIAIGLLCTLYLYLYSILGVAMPFLSYFGLLAPEPQRPAKPVT